MTAARKNFEEPVTKHHDPPHYLVGRVFRSYGRPFTTFVVVSVNGKNAYGWERSQGGDVWTWYELEELHTVKLWNLI